MITTSEKLNKLVDVLSRAILGKREIIKDISCWGLQQMATYYLKMYWGGKDALIKGVAKAVDCQFRRVQCTPRSVTSRYNRSSCLQS